MQRLFKTITLFIGLMAMIPAFAWVNVTVTKGDTVDALAQKYAPAGISQMDMVIALRNANPEIAAKGFQTGMKLQVPNTTAEVRQAITGVRQKTTTQVAPAPAPASPVKASPSVTASAAPVKKGASVPAVNASTNKKGVSTATAKVAAKNPVAKTSSPPVKPVPATSAKSAAPVAAKKPTAVSSSTPAPSAVSATSQQLAAAQATIARLQQALNNQAATLQANQTQIANLTSALNAQNPVAESPKSASWLSVSSLGFVLWIITVILWLRMRKKYRTLIRHQSTAMTNSPDHLAYEEKEPTLTPVNTKRPENQATPQAHKVEPKLPEQNNEEDWRQVELDIPVIEAESPLSNSSVEPVLTVEEQTAIAGEQQSIIREIAKDHDNINWHMALLDFYIKTNNPNGFNRHMQTMIRTGLMTDGDTLWEKIRKMYLNGWVYNEER